MVDFAHELSHWSEKSCRSYLEPRDINFIQSILGSKFEEIKFNPELIESLLCENKLLFTILESTEQLPISPRLYFYILLHKAFSDSNICNPFLLDYIVFILITNINNNFSHNEVLYISDYLTKIDLANDKEQFYLRIELSNQILFLTGLFRDFLNYHTQRTGAPSISFYEGIGSSQYNAAMHHPLANELHLKNVFVQLSYDFSSVRQTLNQFSERFISLGDPFIRHWLL